VFIPTKGRHDCAAFPDLLRDEGLTFTLVVEPQDEASYRSVYPDAEYLVLPENDRGLWFSCQNILEYCRENGISRFWRVDDNVRGFYKTVKNKNVACEPIEALSYAESLASARPRIGVIGFQYKQFAWSAKKAYAFNRRVHCCVLVDSAAPANYREIAEGKEDIDHFMQCLTSGWATVVVNQYAMDKPVMGRNAKGGLAEWYRSGGHNDVAKVVVRLWPQYCYLIEKDLGLDVGFHWAEIDRLWNRQKHKTTND